MHFFTILFAAVLALMSHTTASALTGNITASAPRSDDAVPKSEFKDWKVSKVKVRSPTGFPGTYAWAIVKATVKDHNKYNLGMGPTGHFVTVKARKKSVKCKLRIETATEMKFSYRKWPCQEVKHGYWTVEVLPSTVPPKGDEELFDNFSLRFTHVVSRVTKGVDPLRITAEGHFDVRNNTRRTKCEDREGCKWKLMRKVSIVPKEVSC